MKITANQFMSTLSATSAHRYPLPKLDAAKPACVVVERFVDGKWVWKKLVWNGTQYVEVK